MIPIYKLLSLGVRVFSRPLINLTKQYHANNPIERVKLRQMFYRLGNWFHRVDTRINRHYLRVRNPNAAIQPLS